MTLARKVVLRCRTGAAARVAALVEGWLRDGVCFVAVMGEDCDRVEDMIDELVVGDTTGPDRFILTSAHAGETLDAVVRFAEALTGEYAGPVAIVDV